MIIDSKQECIVLLDEEYRDLRYIAEAMSSTILGQKIAQYLHKSGMSFMQKVNKQIKENENPTNFTKSGMAKK